ncbi:hypothetical protein EDC36_12120 [Tepidimonas ignava]|uniref:HDOD domain-containing protein n=2 Tax=Tepidimonas ignava TaxID=114249 RepID=A0A4R3L938_9BURK|nr:hypothetical protein EDC36_12120 [Tepidimonas ignava]TSE18756.1 hypothetical protein Tigna_02466 [Tepidimonas ignava]
MIATPALSPKRPMSPTPAPPTAAPLPAWLTAAHVQALPLLLDDAALDDDITAQALARLLRRDPPLGLRLMAQAQRRLRPGQAVRDVEHALALLGVGAAQTLLRQASRQRFDPHQPGHLALAEAVATSVLGAHWAQACAHIDGRADHAAVFWQAVQLGRSQWHWALADPARAEACRQRVAAGERAAALQRQWLGQPLAAWDAPLALASGLADPDDPPATPSVTPAMLRAAARSAWTGHDPVELPAALARWLRQPALAPLLWHRLACEAMADWHSPRTRLWLRVLSALRGWHLDDTTAFAHRHAAEASRGLSWAVWVGAPAARLLWARPPRRQPPRATPPASDPATAEARPTPSAATSAPRPAHVPPPAVAWDVERFIEACHAQRFDTVAGLLQALAATLQQALALPRFALLMRTTDPNTLACIAAHGFGGVVQPRRLQVALAGAPLLARLLNQAGAFMHVQPAQVPLARAQLPPPLDAQVPEGGLVLGTLTVRGRAAGVLWADGGLGAPALTDVQYQGVKRLTVHLARELTRLLVQQQRRGAPSAGPAG